MACHTARQTIAPRKTISIVRQCFMDHPNCSLHPKKATEGGGPGRTRVRLEVSATATSSKRKRQRTLHLTRIFATGDAVASGAEAPHISYFSPEQLARLSLTPRFS